MVTGIDSLVLMSGGIDSAACAHFLKRTGHNVRALFLNYGQRAARAEEVAAKKLSSELGLTLSTAVATVGRSFGPGEIVGRNAYLIIAAMLCGSCEGTGSIALGIHSGTEYYDCTPAFVTLIDRLVAEHTDGRRRVIAPFLAWTKGAVLNYYVEAGLRLHDAYSCEAGELPPCGTCLSCKDRALLG